MYRPTLPSKALRDTYITERPDMPAFTRIVVLILAVTGLSLAQPRDAMAAGLPNDNFANAAVISSFPFGDIVDNTTATTEPGEPAGNCGLSEHQTVWYTITPTSDIVVQIDMMGSTIFDPIVNVYQQGGTGLGGLQNLKCGSFNPVTLSLTANVTYYIQAGDEGLSTGGKLHLNVQQISPPPDDNFGNATAISPAALPFSDTETALAATTEPGEPVPTCSPRTTISNSWWYSFTTTSNGSFTAQATSLAILAVYTGSTLADLSQIGCSVDFPLVTFKAVAGTTYYLQVSDTDNGASGPIAFTLDHAPQPVANFSTNLSDPSIFDTVQFINTSEDPARVGFASDQYNFGDGTSAAGCCANEPGAVDTTRQYAKDGTYTVTDTVTTTDGRTATISQVVQVSTHDVAITKLTVPASASVGRTRPITVQVSDKRYPETVQMQLFRSNSTGGFDLVGTLTQSITVKSGKQTTPFAFTYTFTPADGAVGKVTFEAIATIQGARDALPADNTAFALTTVR
jgi:hypothetical protein